MTRHVRLVLNGQSAGNQEVRGAVRRLRERGHTVEVRVTWEEGDAERMAREAATDGVDVVVGGGGDGTLHEVLNGIAASDSDRRPAIGVLPLGTANDFAAASGIPLRDPHAALLLAAEGDAVRIDVGRVNGRLFLNVASGGLGAEITSSTPVELKRLIGGAAYTLMGLVTARQIEPYQARVRTPDHEDEGDVLILTVGNSRLAGGGKPVAPEAMLDDGLLDLLVVHDVEGADFRVLLDELLDLQFDDRRFVRYLQVPSVTLEFGREFPLNLDGEQLRDRKFEIEVVPSAVEVVLPSDCELIA